LDCWVVCLGEHASGAIDDDPFAINLFADVGDGGPQVLCSLCQYTLLEGLKGEREGSTAIVSEEVEGVDHALADDGGGKLVGISFQPTRDKGSRV
jgi:hypothetical protein